MRTFSLLPSAALVVLSVGCGASPEPAALTAIDSSVTELKIWRVSLGVEETCNTANREVSYLRASRTMTWPACAGRAGSTGSDAGAAYGAIARALTDDEAKQVEDALARVTYTTGADCPGHDGIEHYMTTKATNGIEARYSAQNVNCYGLPRAPQIATAYELFVSLRDR